MGLALVELVMEVEDEFEIQIADDDAGKIQTCGDLHAYVCHRLRPLRGAPCQSAAAFHRVRRAVLHYLPVERRHVRPAAMIHKLMGQSHAHRWPSIAMALNLQRHYSFNGAVDIYPPAPYTTLGQLARRMAFPRWTDRPTDHDAFTHEIWEKVRKIISTQLGVGLEEIQPHTHFINDLNAD